MYIKVIYNVSNILLQDVRVHFRFYFCMPPGLIERGKEICNSDLKAGTFPFGNCDRDKNDSNIGMYLSLHTAYHHHTSFDCSYTSWFHQNAAILCQIGYTERSLHFHHFARENGGANRILAPLRV